VVGTLEQPGDQLVDDRVELRRRHGVVITFMSASSRPV